MSFGLNQFIYKNVRYTVLRLYICTLFDWSKNFKEKYAYIEKLLVKSLICIIRTSNITKYYITMIPQQ